MIVKIKENQINNYGIVQVLCGVGLTWVSSAHGRILSDAVCAGNQSNGEPLYVGRAKINGSLTTGKVQSSHNCIYVPFGGTEHSFRQYEVLIAPKRRCEQYNSNQFVL